MENQQKILKLLKENPLQVPPQDVINLIEFFQKEINKYENLIKKYKETEITLEKKITDLVKKTEIEKSNHNIAENLRKSAYQNVVAEIFKEPIQNATKEAGRKGVIYSVFITALFTGIALIISTYQSNVLQVKNDKKTESLIAGVDAVINSVDKSNQKILPEIKQEIKTKLNNIEINTTNALLALNKKVDKSMIELQKNTQNKLSDISKTSSNVEKKLSQEVYSVTSRMEKEIMKEINILVKNITERQEKMATIISFLEQKKEELNSYEKKDDIKKLYVVFLSTNIAPAKYDIYIEVFKNYGINPEVIPTIKDFVRWDKLSKQLYKKWIRDLNSEVDKSKIIPENKKLWNNYKDKTDTTTYNYIFANTKATYQNILNILKINQNDIIKQLHLNGIN